MNEIKKENMHKEKEHRELHKKIVSCKCLPLGKKEDYCNVCQKAVIDFMNEHGAGTLTRDLLAYDLNKEIARLQTINSALQGSLDKKIKEFEMLKGSSE